MITREAITGLKLHISHNSSGTSIPEMETSTILAPVSNRLQAFHMCVASAEFWAYSGRIHDTVASDQHG